MSSSPILRPPEQIASNWNAVVDTYEECLEPFTNQIAADAFDLAPIGPGYRVLDVATGPGGLALAALARGAEVTAIDIAPLMIDRLRRRLSREERWRSMALVMDGENLALPDNTFHAAYSIFGLIFFPDAARGLRELHRTLKPDGRAVIAAWSSPQRHEALRLIGEVLCSVWPDFQSQQQMPPWLRFQDAAVLHDALLNAGFRSPRVHTVSRPWEMPSAEWIVERVAHISPGANHLFEQMPPARADRFRTELLERLRSRFGAGPIRFSAEAHLGVGEK